MQSKARILTRKIHFWIGIVTGIILFIVSITGCLYVFKNEINRAVRPWSRITTNVNQSLPPSVLLEKAQPFLKEPVTGLEVYPNAPAVVSSNKGEYRQSIFLNPETGAHLYTSGVGGHFDFFDCMLKGHRYLWLPPAIGKPIVGGSVIVFFFILVTGIILWFPYKWKKKLFKQALTIKKNAHWKRRNYDLHSVLGFYASLFLMVSIVTGLMFAYPWFSKAIYKTFSMGREMPKQESEPGKTKASDFDYTRLDSLVKDLRPSFDKGDNGYYIRFPKNGKSAILFGTNDKPGTYYKLSQKAYNKDFNEVKYVGRYAGSYETASLADKVQRLNYDIHVGAYGGIANKILAFVVGLIAASLPVTGVLAYIARTKKKKPIRVK